MTFALSSPVPNPSRGIVRLTLELPAPSSVEASVYDVTGRRIVGLHRGTLQAGRHPLHWDGRTAEGAAAPSGLYFARVRSDLGVRSQVIVRE